MIDNIKIVCFSCVLFAVLWTSSALVASNYCIEKVLIRINLKTLLVFSLFIEHKTYNCWSATFNKCIFGQMFKPCYELKYTWDNEYECTKFMEYHGLGRQYYDPFDTYPDTVSDAEWKEWQDSIYKNPDWDTATPRDHNEDDDPPWFPTNAEKFAEEWHGKTNITTETPPSENDITEKSFLWWLEDPNNQRIRLKERVNSTGYYDSGDPENWYYAPNKSNNTANNSTTK